METNKKGASWIRFLKFIAVGMTGTLVDFGILDCAQGMGSFPNTARQHHFLQCGHGEQLCMELPVDLS